MMYRCYRPINTAYIDYGGRGIKVCLEWQDFETFYEWTKGRWAPGLQIDRENNDGDYCPDNCRFVTCQVNNSNRRVRMDSSTGYAGVTQRGTRYRAQIWFGSCKTLGQFATAEEAVVVRNKYIVANGLPHPVQAITTVGRTI